jgi:nitrogen-specific signal transduction histidine kinase/CheY-like chemotaxis protein
MVGIIWDITDEFRLRERLIQSERLEALGLLAGGVAHDFNNQLSVILAESEVMNLNGGVTPLGAAHLGHITQAAEASTALIRDLLSFSKRRDVMRSSIDLCMVIRQAARIATRSLGTSIQCEVNIPETPFWVMGNPGQLENAILNLCINARDAMGEGGSLSIRVERREVIREFCHVMGADFSGEFAVISICDTGSGIPEDISGRIFEPFFTTKPDGKGTGLGLATVLGCVAGHEGHLTFDTVLGRGTTFTIFLAFATPAAPAVVPVARGTPRTGRLLLLEDQDAVRHSISDGLRLLGWEVVDFESPREALAAWGGATPRFALALVDLVMPDMSGSAVFRELRRLDPHAQVVLMSGHTAGENLDALRREGLAAFVEKPVKLRQLASLLGTLIKDQGL